MMKRKILKATQSPLNPTRWSLDLECGHELWETLTRRPRLGAWRTCTLCKLSAKTPPQGAA